MSAVRNSSFTAAVSLGAMLAFSTAAFAADITLENIKVNSPNGKSTAEIKKVLVTGTNLTKDELGKLFDTASSKEDRLAITSKMKADMFSIPEVVVNRNDSTGRITISGVAITGIDAGKFAKASVASVTGGGETKKDAGQFSLKSGPMVLSDGNLTKAMTAMKSGDITDGTWQFGKFSWTGFEIVVPEKSGDTIHKHTFKIGLVEGETKYDGAVPTTTTGFFKDVTFIPAPDSQAGQGMGAFGYKQVTLGMTFAGVYDEKSKKYKLSDYTIKGDDTAVVSIAGTFGNIDKTAFTGDKRQRLGALMGGDVDDVTIKVINNSLLDKALVFFAKMKGADPQAIKQQWAGMAGGMLPMVLGGDAGALQSAQAVTDFIKTPKNLTITASGKAGPVPFSTFAQTTNPMQMFSKLKVEAVANK
ncbi:MAG: hypothetical protein NWT00_06085 [Beijerinckiaceae bacterium]|nr:hypothetical protein [Beijerinckiaceae bacterium]